MKKCKMICAILAFSILVSLVTPAHAAVTASSDLTDVLPDATGTFTQTDQLGDSTYYFEKTDTYVLAIGISDAAVDCAIRYLDTNETYAKVYPVDSIASVYQAQKDVSVQIGEIRLSILTHDLDLPKTEPNKPLSMQQIQRVGSAEKEIIMQQLYNEGYPRAQQQTFVESRTKNGITANLYQSISYTIRDRDVIVLAAKTALSLAMTEIGLPAMTLKSIIQFAITVNGVWETVNEVAVKKYETYLYGRKYVRINGENYYTPGLTIYWLAYVGDIGAALDLQSEQASQYYYNTDKLFEVGFDNYNSMS